MGTGYARMRHCAMLVVAMFAVVLGITIPVYAGPLSGGMSADGLDLNRMGSVNVTLKYEGEPVNDGVMALIQVADLMPENGTISYVYTDDFLDCKVELGDLTAPKLAQTLNEAVSGTATWVTKNVDKDGSVLFTDLLPGLYLIRQTKECAGYKAAAPFLVTVPILEEGSWNYEVDATPKLEIRRPEGTTTPSNPPSPPRRIPQTGQVNWPIPVLVIAGLILIVLGLVLRRGARKH